jgi:DNA-binding beta-propeller fold protein YncE
MKVEKRLRIRWIYRALAVVLHVILLIGVADSPVIAHTEYAENTSPEVTLEEVLSVGRLDDDALFQWVGVTVDPSGQIYVTDAMDYSLKKFDADGRLLQKAGRKGQGPGEFLAPRLLVRSENHLFVTDQSIPGIQVFDFSLRFVRRIPVKIPIGDVFVLSDEKIAVVALSFNQPGCIHVYNHGGQMLRQIDYAGKKEASMRDWVEIAFDSEDCLYVLYNFQDRIEKFDAGGGRVWLQSLLDLKKIKTKKVGPWTVPDKIIYKDLVFDSDGRLYVLGGGYSENPSRDVYVLNPGGAHVTTFTLPEASHCIYIDSKDFLYSRANDGITLKKYRIKWRNI